MQKIIHKTVFVTLIMIVGFSLKAQNNFFTNAGENSLQQTTGLRVTFPEKFRSSSFNIENLKSFLWSLPAEKNIINNRNNTPVIELPMPNGTMAKFHVW